MLSVERLDMPFFKSADDASSRGPGTATLPDGDAAVMAIMLRYRILMY